jgi:hypothetical protein
LVGLGEAVLDYFAQGKDTRVLRKRKGAGDLTTAPLFD